MALGPVTAANGAMYCASMSGAMFALNAGSGKTLWSFQAAGLVNAAPAVVNGVVYWGSGYHNFPESKPVGTVSNYFYVFAIPRDKAELAFCAIKPEGGALIDGPAAAKGPRELLTRSKYGLRDLH
jgi:PQQ enzyme repeat